MSFDFNSLVNGLSADVLAEMDATNTSNGIPLSDKEKETMQKLTAACLLKKTSQRKVIDNFKEYVDGNEKLAPWFPEINKERSASNFKKEFVKVYAELKVEFEKAVAAKLEADKLEADKKKTAG